MHCAFVATIPSLSIPSLSIESPFPNPGQKGEIERLKNHKRNGSKGSDERKAQIRQTDRPTPDRPTSVPVASPPGRWDKKCKNK